MQTSTHLGGKMLRTALLPLAVLTLTACEPRGEVVLYPDAERFNSVETVFIGTTRAPDPETGEFFGKVRSQSIRYVQLDVAIPPEREPGEIVWPRKRRAPDPETQFLATRVRVFDEAQGFRADLKNSFTEARRGEREAVVFVHGFNNNFAEGAYRLAQLGHDLELRGELIHYSWPSRAHPLGYAYDRDSALFARDGLETLLNEVEAAGAESILLVAHSMGSALTMETLRQITIRGNGQLINKISGVALISPDIDVDVFRAQSARIGELPQPFIIFTSKKDRALALSARLTGQHDRLGNVTDVAELADLKVTLLDTTAFSSGIGHFTPGDSPALLKILSRIADVGDALAADQTGRTGLLPGAVLTVQSATEIVLSPVTALSGGTP